HQLVHLAVVVKPGKFDPSGDGAQLRRARATVSIAAVDGGDPGAVRAELYPAHAVVMIQAGQLSPASCIEPPCRAAGSGVAACGGDLGAVGAVHQSVHPAVVVEPNEFLSAGPIEHPRRPCSAADALIDDLFLTVTAGRGDLGTVRAEHR